MRRLEVLTIPAMLQASYRDFADNQSLIFVGEENLTYKQLETEVKKAALQLWSAGVKKGDKVAILSLNMPQWGHRFFRHFGAWRCCGPNSSRLSPKRN